MFRAIDDFTNDWRHESAATLKLLRLLTDDAFEWKAFGREPEP
jgi:hypothetical protein